MFTKISLAFAVLFCTTILHAQLNYIAPGASLKFTSETYKRSYEEIVKVDADFIFTTDGSLDLYKYDKETLNRVWEKELEKKPKYNKQKLDLVKSFLNSQNQWVIIYKSYDGKKRETVLYKSVVAEDETPATYEEFCRVPLLEEADARYKFYFADDEIILLCLADYVHKKYGKMHAIWFDKNLEETNRMEQQTWPTSENFQSIAYNPANQALYVTVRSNNKYINGKPLELTHAYYTFNLSEKKADKKELMFEDFRIYSANINLMPETQTPFLVTLVGDKKKRNVSATGYFLMDKTEAAIEEKKFFPISKEVVAKVVESKTKAEKFLSDAKAVNLVFDSCYFKPDGSFYTVFEDQGSNDFGKYNRGQYIMLLDENLDLEWQDFSILFGYGSAITLLKNNALEIYQFLGTKFIEDTYPLKEVPDPGVYDCSVMKITISPDIEKAEHIAQFNAKENRQYRMYPEFTKYSIQQNVIYLNGFNVTTTGKLAEIKLP